MKFSFQTTTELKPEEIWIYYENVKKWKEWIFGLEAIRLNGKFESGSAINVTMANLPPLKLMLVSVKENQSFIFEVLIPQTGMFIFRSDLIRKNGLTTVQHTIEFLPDAKEEKNEDVQMGLTIFSHVPTNTLSLIRTARVKNTIII